MSVIYWSDAHVSACWRFRYALWREWDKQLPKIHFIMLNPSTADETEDDPTIRRCINFAQAWGGGSLVVTNLFALRSTDPRALKKVPDPVGPENDRWIMEQARISAMTVCAWGTHGSFLGRSRKVTGYLARAGIKLYCLKKTSSGEPCHPLYLRSDLDLVRYS